MVTGDTVMDPDVKEFFSKLYELKEEFVESGMAEKVGNDIKKLARFITDFLCDEAIRSYKKFIDAGMTVEHAAALTQAIYFDISRNIERGVKNIKINI